MSRKKSWLNPVFRFRNRNLSVTSFLLSVESDFRILTSESFGHAISAFGIAELRIILLSRKRSWKSEVGLGHGNEFEQNLAFQNRNESFSRQVVYLNIDYLRISDLIRIVNSRFEFYIILEPETESILN